MLFRKILILFIFVPFQTMALPLVPLVLQVLTETVSLNFGSIVGQGGSSCAMDISGSISGQCISADSNVTPGQVVISGLTGSSQVEIVISGTDNGQLAFVASAGISGGNAGQMSATDGQAVTITTQANGADITIDIYGQMTLQTNVTSNQSHTVDYNVQVNLL